jgi:hypothetical protein
MMNFVQLTENWINKQFRGCARHKLGYKKMKTISFFLIAVMAIGLIACSGKNKTVENPLNENWITSNDVELGIAQKAKEEETGLIEFIKRMDGKKVTTSNKNVSVYSLANSKTCLTIPVVFNQDEPIANMRDFVAVVNEISEQLFMKPQLKDKLMGIFLGLTSDGEAVCGLSMYPQEQVFSLRGLDFMSENADIYRDAFDTLVKEKTRKKNINEWDYFIYRSLKKPEFGNLTETCERVLIPVAGTTIISLYKFKDGFEDLLLSNKYMAESIFSVVSENEESKQILNIGFSVNTIWFNSSGNRIMAELARKLPSGKISKERKWYNGYSEPK